jgi:hypothetical protein
MIATVENKVTIDQFFDAVEWGNTSPLYWKSVIRMLEHASGSLSVISNWKEVMGHPLMQQVKYVPYYRDGLLYLSEAIRIGKYVRRIMYIKRGNSIPGYGYKDKKFKTFFKNTDGSYNYDYYTQREVISEKSK